MCYQKLNTISLHLSSLITTSCSLLNEDSIFLHKSFKFRLNASLVDKSKRIVGDAPGIETAGIVIIP